MAAVLEKTDVTARHNSQVDEQIAQATSRIRAHDLTFGGLVLLALVLGYAVTMICLDKYLVLPEWVRQLSLVGFVGVLAGTAYLTLLSPLRKRINPLYAAKQVERTIDDAKNSVTGYVDARENGDLNATVKAALASRAAAASADADVNRAVDHTSLRYLGGLAIVCFLALVVLFFVFRPAQFASLAGRAFVPFTKAALATQTQLTLVNPTPGDQTITTGQTVAVQVHVAGKVPKADGPDKVRLLVRHNPADPNYEELPMMMVQGATSRDWELSVPSHLVQNGFWYKVKAGDAETAEHQVTVRSLPVFTAYTVTYEYPKYLRRKNDVITDADATIRAYRGTTVTLIAKANREVRSGEMTIDRGPTVVGVPVPGKPDSLQFTFKLTTAGSYRLAFVAANGERNADTFPKPIALEADLPPQLVINRPEEDETTLAANGQLAVDGKIGDDLGIDTVTLKMKLVAPVERPLPDVPYLNGKVPSFRRDKDQSFPTSLDYKGSVDLAKLTKDATGLALVLDDKCVIEYWLEATDNCTEPKANVGRSAPKRVRLTPPTTEPMEQMKQDQRKQERNNEEQKHADNQQKNLQNEKRDPNPKGGQGQPDQKEGGDPNPKPDPNEQPKNPPEGKKDGTNDKGDPKGGNKSDVGKTADDLQRELDREKMSGGDAKPNPQADTKPEDRANPAEQKPQPQNMGGMNGASEPKPEPKQPDPMMPMGMSGGAPSESKAQGDTKQPEQPGQPKPQPPQGGMNDKKENAPAEDRGAPGNTGGAPGAEKAQPPAPKDPPPMQDPKQDPKSGSTGKPGTEQKEPQPGMGKSGPPESAPKPGAQQPKPGDEKPTAPPPTDPKANPDNKPGRPDAGDAKPQTAPPAAGTKPMPKDDMMGMGGADAQPKPAGGANDPKDPKGGTNAAETKPDDMKKDPPMAGGKPLNKGDDKPAPKDTKGQPDAGGNNAPMPTEKGDDKRAKELSEAANDLTGDDDAKKQAAREKLDKAFGEKKRKDIEQIANDLNSDDKATRDAAREKIDKMNKDAKEKKDKDPKGGDTTSIKFKDPKAGEDAVEDLKNPDPNKKKAAQDKLDKAIGEQNRKELEQAMDDLDSKDPKRQADGEKKLKDLQDKLAKKDDAPPKDKEPTKGKEPAKGKEPTPEEIDDLMNKAKDLNSPDEAKRKQAEKDVDAKIGEEARKKLQEEMKKRMEMPPTPEQLKQEMEKWRQGPGGSPANKGLMESDAANRAKTAQLQLEDFKKDENKERIKKLKNWTEEEYQRFVKDLEREAERLKTEAAKPPVAPAPTPKGPKEPKEPTVLTPGTGGKVEGPRGPNGDAGVGGPTVAPPGFENLQNKFKDALKKKP